jgi:hypothetical protein
MVYPCLSLAGKQHDALLAHNVGHGGLNLTVVTVDTNNNYVYIYMYIHRYISNVFGAFWERQVLNFWGSLVIARHRSHNFSSGKSVTISQQKWGDPSVSWHFREDFWDSFLTFISFSEPPNLI